MHYNNNKIRKEKNIKRTYSFKVALKRNQQNSI